MSEPTPILQRSASLRGRVLVTGCAGFIGSHLCEKLVAGGADVVGVDCFTDYYEEPLKRLNLVRLLDEPRFTFHQADLSEVPLDPLLEGVDTIIHLAGQAGVRASFGDGFASYLRHNVLATKRLLEASDRVDVDKFVYASSSSVYGDAAAYPTPESTDRRPVSPYGLTKVTTEDLAEVHHRTMGTHTVGLRYFTVYGPRQRPDMAFTKFFKRALAGEPLPMFGDGRQVRDFTFVEDIVSGTIASALHGHAGSVYNLGGGEPVELCEVIAMMSELIGREIAIDRLPTQPGEASKTTADCTRAERELGWTPQTRLRPGLAAQLAWIVDLLSAGDVEAIAA